MARKRFACDGLTKARPCFWLCWLMAALMIAVTPSVSHAKIVEVVDVPNSLSEILRPQDRACQMEEKDVLSLMIGLNLAYDFGLIAGAMVGAIVTRTYLWTAVGALIGGTSTEILYLVYQFTLETC